MLITTLFLYVTLSAHLVQKESYPKREVAIIASKDSFWPNYITAYQGENLYIYFTSLADQSCFIIKEKKFLLSARQGELVEGNIFFDRAGIYTFFCPAMKNGGKIFILGK